MMDPVRDFEMITIVTKKHLLRRIIRLMGTSVHEAYLCIIQHFVVRSMEARSTLPPIDHQMTVGLTAL